MVASISAIKNASAGVRYFENEGYYAEGSEEHRAASFWHGKGAEELGLIGNVDGAAFSKVLNGYVPGTTTRLGRMRNGVHEHRPGTDITLSAPKSVSMALYLSGDKRILEAHARAVKNTIDYAEKHVVQTRMKTDDGKMARVGDQKIVVATFTHKSSRGDDPNHHTHCVFVNMVFGEDGKWRTMENRSLFDNKMLLGQIFHSELAKEMKELGYGIVITGKNGIFELDGAFTKKQMAAFSRRSDEIKKEMEDNGEEKTAKNAAKAAIKTRPNKTIRDADELDQEWEERAKEAGIEYGASSDEKQLDEAAPNDQIQEPDKDEMTEDKSAKLPDETKSAADKNTKSKTEDVGEQPVEKPSKDKKPNEKDHQSDSSETLLDKINQLDSDKTKKGQIILPGKASNNPGPNIQQASIEATKNQTHPLVAPGITKKFIDRTKRKTLVNGKFVDRQQSHANNTPNKPLDPAAQAAYEKKISIEAVRWAARHLEERNSVFKKSDLLKEALNYSLGTVDVESIGIATKQVISEGRIVESKYNSRSYTTDKTINLEREMIKTLNSTKDSRWGVVGNWSILKAFFNSNLTDGQKSAVNLILQNRDMVVGVQGYAGTGKTTMLNVMRKLAGENRVLGFAPSASAANTLEKETGIQSATLQSFLFKHNYLGKDERIKATSEQIKEFKGKILVVDEASLASTKQMRDLLILSEKLSVRQVVLVGDSKQLDAVDAGAPFKQLQDAGMKTAFMLEIKRQRDSELKSSVLYAIKGDPRSALKKLDPHIKEVDRLHLGVMAARTWLGLSPEMREKTGVMAPTNEIREVINETIRDELKQFGEIYGKEADITRLTPTRLTLAEKELAHNWQKGEVVLFERDIRSADIKAGEKWTVIDRRPGEVDISNEQGILKTIDPAGGIAKNLDLYEVSDMKLQAGDKIRWTRNEKKLGLINSHQAKILEVDKNKITFKTEGSIIMSLPTEHSAFSHSDYAFSATVYAFQGKTFDRIIAVLDTFSKMLTNLKTFYVEISRPRDNAIIITNSKSRLADVLELNTGERTTALDFLSDPGGKQSGPANYNPPHNQIPGGSSGQGINNTQSNAASGVSQSGPNENNKLLTSFTSAEAALQSDDYLNLSDPSHDDGGLKEHENRFEGAPDTDYEDTHDMGELTREPAGIESEDEKSENTRNPVDKGKEDQEYGL